MATTDTGAVDDGPTADELSRMYENQQRTRDDIAESFGLSAGDVAGLLVEHGIVEVEEPWRDPTTLYRLFHIKGMSQADVAEELGCSTPTAHNWLHEFNICTDGARRQVYIDRNDLLDAYVRRDLSVAECAEAFETSTPTILDRLDRFGIPTDDGTTPQPTEQQPMDAEIETLEVDELLIPNRAFVVEGTTVTIDDSVDVDANEILERLRKISLSVVVEETDDELVAAITAE